MTVDPLTVVVLAAAAVVAIVFGRILGFVLFTIANR